MSHPDIPEQIGPHSVPREPICPLCHGQPQPHPFSCGCSLLATTVPPREEITCPDCRCANCFRRVIDGIHDIKCPDCGVVVGEANIKPGDIRNSSGPSPVPQISQAAARELMAACEAFVDYYDQSGMPDDLTEEVEDDPPDPFDGDEVFNVRHGREALAHARRDLAGTEGDGA